MHTRKNILICPLEWGLGHAGRMVPLAKKIIDLDHNVIVGSGAEHLEFFRKELPGIKCISFPGFRIRYSSWLPQYLAILLSAPAFTFQIIKEHRQLKKIIAEHKIDIVISDSRPGLWNRSVKTVFVTHMVRVPFPGWARLIEKSGVFSPKRIMKRFTFCFIPDLEGTNNLSGKLSHNVKLPDNARYVGILSRFSEPTVNSSAEEYNYLYTVILSGPEPQRGIMRQKMTEILRSCGERSVILEGKPGGITERHTEGKITYISHLSAMAMKELIIGSRFIVSRSGYTTIMELTSLGKTAFIIPTPGQTEQEYLAEYLSARGWFSTISQKELNVNSVLADPGSSIPENLVDESRKLLESGLSELLEEQHQ